MSLFKTFLKPSESVMVSMATVALEFGVYQYSMPSLAAMHQTEPNNTNIDASRKKAMWTSAAVVGGMFLLTHDPNVFMAGGIAFLALEWTNRHANASSPATGKLVQVSKANALGEYMIPDSPDDSLYQPEYYG